MTGLRALCRTNGWLAAILVAAVLMLRIAVPAGTMPVMENHSLALVICTGTGPATGSIDIPLTKHGPAAAERCAFADLALPLLGAADTYIVALALAFALTLWLARLAPLSALRQPHLRPPLRGPPSLA